MKRDESHRDLIPALPRGAFEKDAKKVATTVQPDWTVSHEPAQEHGGHAGPSLSTVREADHRGHKIVIKTIYDITIDGKPYRGRVRVGEDGQLHCHAIPYESYGSMIDFVKSLIDVYSRSFPLPECGDAGNSRERLA